MRQHGALGDHALPFVYQVGTARRSGPAPKR